MLEWRLECKYYDHTMKRKNQNKCYRARVVTLIIVFRSIYQIFRSITLEYVLITNYCLINSVINILATFQRTFVATKPMTNLTECVTSN